MKLTRSQLRQMLALSKNGQHFLPVSQVPAKTIRTAIKSYAGACAPDRVVGLMDTTLFGSGRKGFLLARDALYGDCLGCSDRPENHSLALDDIRAVEPLADSPQSLLIRYDGGREVVIHVPQTYFPFVETVLRSAVPAEASAPVNPTQPIAPPAPAAPPGPTEEALFRLTDPPCSPAEDPAGQAFVLSLRPLILRSVLDLGLDRGRGLRWNQVCAWADAREEDRTWSQAKLSQGRHQLANGVGSGGLWAALTCFHEATRFGNPEAAYLMGRCLSLLSRTDHPSAVPPDVLAHFWYSEAAADSCPDADARLAALVKRWSAPRTPAPEAERRFAALAEAESDPSARRGEDARSVRAFFRIESGRGDPAAMVGLGRWFALDIGADSPGLTLTSPLSAALVCAVTAARLGSPQGLDLLVRLWEQQVCPAEPWTYDRRKARLAEGLPCGHRTAWGRWLLMALRACRPGSAAAMARLYADSPDLAQRPEAAQWAEAARKAPF